MALTKILTHRAKHYDIQQADYIPADHKRMATSAQVNRSCCAKYECLTDVP